MTTDPQIPRNPDQACYIPIRRLIIYSVLALILATGLYFRVANLGSVQQFEGDHGRDYMIVMDFVLDGQWPLLGPWRRVGDFAIGPGWYYTILPALVLSGFHPAAGATFIALMGTLMIFLCWLWVRRRTGSELAAMAAAACLAFSFGWVVWDRTLCNPNILPLATVLLVFLIGMIPRRPVAGLALYVMLAAILPQWHTTGFLSIAASLPVVAWVGVRAWPLMRRTPRMTWLLWGTATILALGLLYGPPILYELKPGPGNLKGYIKRTIGPSDAFGQTGKDIPEKPSILQTATRNSVWYFSNMTNRIFGWQLFVRPFFIAVLIGWALLWVVMAALHLFQRRLDPAVAFLLFMVLGYWLVCAVRVNAMMSYFLAPVQPAPILLSAWSAGLLLTEPYRKRWLRELCNFIGLGLLGSAAYLTAIQAGAAARIHKGDVFYDHEMLATRTLCDSLYEEVGDKPYNLFFLQEGNFPPHIHYMMRYNGNRPHNHAYFCNEIGRPDFTQRMYIITRGYGEGIPIEYHGLPDLNLKPQALVDAFVYRLSSDQIPADITALVVRIENGRLIINGKGSVTLADTKS